jgi:protein-ribulosamine 3-kinase
MLEGEFESMSVIHSITPSFAPKPITWGTFESDDKLHFFICDFHHMDGEIPEQNAFAENLAKLHRESKSPEGKFGFHVTTYNGNLPQDVRWTSTWEECFVNGTKKDFELEREVRGLSPELEELMEPLFSKVIPRLLRPMETEGRSIKPCFVHGDLWHGNTSNDANTGLPLVFDAAGFYGHNECE